ncbi:hypothetical protein [Marinomonas sp. TW1]|uniref:hypothetical protein n=1 Tax=Marinomonas sp. TW1 TaxID=1561203 RepID=UPI0007AFDB3B|nr:hypothetical protein [Marinomonas sp. TW1]KZN14594.1 hypothetical protein OA79_04790 [Marinomonas sp. TW1]
MLKRVRFLGFKVKEITFENKDVKSDGGFLNIESDLRSDVKVFTDEDGDSFFKLLVDVTLKGMDSDKETEVFGCYELLELNFVCLKGLDDNDEAAIGSCLDDGSWFFQNFIDTAVYNSLKNILTNTSFDDISIPPVSNLDE